MSKEPRAMIYTAKNISALATSGESVTILVDCPDLGIAPEVQLAFRLSPQEARQIAEGLLRKADEAEAKQHPRQ